MARSTDPADSIASADPQAGDRMHVCLFDTPIGRCGIAWGPRGIMAVQLPERSDDAALARLKRGALRLPRSGEHAPLPEFDLVRPGEALPAHVQQAIDGVIDMLNGGRDPLLHIELNMEGVPPFHQQVYACARRIAPGKTLTYGEIAREVGEPGASRAVGQALGHNPFAPIVPCHRVLAAGARSGGFSAVGGVDTKLRMLLIEKAAFGEPGLFD